MPIVTGMVRAFGLPLKSAFGAMLLITVAQVDSVWNVGIKTAAAQNMVLSLIHISEPTRP